MKRRGRPPYPDLLTPRESEVLSLLRRGMSNPEIATHMGISRDGVKYHVSEILSKLGVTSREEAATWAAPGMPGRRWLPAFLAPAKLFTLKTAGAAVIAVALGAMGLLALGVLASGRGSGTGQGPILIEIEGPIEDTSALQDVNYMESNGFYRLVIDTTNNHVYGVRSLCFDTPDEDEAPPPGRYACWVARVDWVDEDTLRVETELPRRDPLPPGPYDAAVYHVDLSGRVSRTMDPPGSLTDASPPSSVVSADGRWRFLAQVIDGREDTTIDVFRLPPVERLFVNGIRFLGTEWSPQGSLLKFTGNYCTPAINERFDLFVLNPEAAELKNLSAGFDQAMLFHEWRPDGEAIAATGIRFGV